MPASGADIDFDYFMIFKSTLKHCDVLHGSHQRLNRYKQATCSIYFDTKINDYRFKSSPKRTNKEV